MNRQFRNAMSFVLVMLTFTMVFSQNPDLVSRQPPPICNPLNLSYRFCLDAPSRREAADSTMVMFRDKYYLFASKSGGYFHSMDLIEWDLILTDDLPLEDWYQGESNISPAAQHRTLFPALIKNWREKWNQGDFPFLFVQLPNFNEPQPEPSDGGWARFRETQTAALAVPNTGMAVAIDIGEWNDIHPLNKKDLGYRLSLAAQKIAYHEKNGVYPGPIYKSVKIDGEKIILSFEQTGGGLVKGPDTLHYFAIAGEHGKFVWATAEIKNNKVVLWSDKIVHPVAVRYAWPDNPEGANLYNKEGLLVLPSEQIQTNNYQQNVYLIYFT